MDRNVLTVANVNGYIKQLMDKDFILKNLWVQGEVSNYKAHSSGHLYFTLKDKTSSISCVMFRSYVGTLDRPLQNGMNIIVTGSISVYERSGQYQIYVKQVKEDGLGRLYQAYEKLKKQLAEEGLFNPEIKRPIPKYAKHVGIITSSTGAAIRDIVQVAKRRNPYIRLTLYPSLVQGADAAANIVKGIEYMNEHYLDMDVLIVGRGGGSIEDLWPFNEEIVARAIFDSQIPIISAVGHETDFTIADFVADHRAPTPSAGAELAVYDVVELKHKLGQYEHRLTQWIKLQLLAKKRLIEKLAETIKHLHPKEKFERQYQYIAELEDKLKLHMNRLMTYKRQRLEVLNVKLKGLSPTHRLTGGYGYISDMDDRKVDCVDMLKKGDHIKITLSDGEVTTKVEKVVKKGFENG